MKTTKKKNSATKKLLPAVGMLAISATMLATSTYAWFTMNKEVSVTGMQLKAHSEEGLLINEVKAAGSNTWDNEAQAVASPTAYALRPASTHDLAEWWHANSKKSNIEAGIDDLDQTVGAAGSKYTDLDTTAIDKTIIYNEGDTTEGHEKATGNTQAETHVWFTNATYGDNDTATEAGYENGEGYYVRYTYYLKSSGESDLELENLQAQVKAVKKNADGDHDSTTLDGALRVGIAVPTSTTTSTIAGRKIFAPVTGADATYSVTNNAAGTGENATTSVTTATATTGSFSTLQRLNLVTSAPGAETTTYASITVPNVTSDGLPVYVYVWFEGEDSHCKSDNLTETLDSYEITVNFDAGDLG